MSARALVRAIAGIDGGALSGVRLSPLERLGLAADRCARSAPLRWVGRVPGADWRVIGACCLLGGIVLVVEGRWWGAALIPFAWLAWRRVWSAPGPRR